MATSKKRGARAKKKTRTTKRAATSADARKKTRRVSRTATVAAGQRDFFGGSVVSPQVEQGHVRRGSLVLSPMNGESKLLLVSSGVAPQPSPRRRGLYLLLLLLLMSGSFWLGRFTYRPAGTPVDFLSAAPASSTVPASGTATATPGPATRSAAAKPAANAASRLVASLKAKVAALERGPGTTLQEVSVGTSTHGGITLRFDHPVSWTVKDNGGHGEAEVDIAGVHNVGTFPRNLPLPPGVMVIHAGINGPDTLRLWFTLLPNLKIFSSPSSGPSAVLNVFFRADTGNSTAPASSQAGQPTGDSVGGITPAKKMRGSMVSAIDPRRANPRRPSASV